MRLSILLRDESGHVDTIAFGRTAEKLTGIDLPKFAITDKLNKTQLPPRVEESMLGREYEFAVTLSDPSGTGILIYKICNFKPLAETAYGSPTAKGKNIIENSSSPTDVIEDTITPTFENPIESSPISSFILTTLFNEDTPATMTPELTLAKRSREMYGTQIAINFVFLYSVILNTSMITNNFALSL